MCTLLQLQLRVNGPPVLNLSRNPAGPNEVHSTPPLSAEDHDLLEQIEKGSLKLGPVHTVSSELLFSPLHQKLQSLQFDSIFRYTS